MLITILVLGITSVFAGSQAATVPLGTLAITSAPSISEAVPRAGPVVLLPLMSPIDVSMGEYGKWMASPPTAAAPSAGIVYECIVSANGQRAIGITIMSPGIFGADNTNITRETHYAATAKHVSDADLVAPKIAERARSGMISSSKSEPISSANMMSMATITDVNASPAPLGDISLMAQRKRIGSG